MVISERRSARRFDVQLPLVVRWMMGSSPSEVVTESKDVSSRGLYFPVSKSINTGSPIEIVMTLPHEITLAGPVRVCCKARIVRTESRAGHNLAVAAAIERYEFLRGSENAA